MSDVGVQRSEVEVFKCQECEYGTSTRKGLNIHQRKKHENPRRAIEGMNGLLRAFGGGQLGYMSLDRMYRAPGAVGRLPIPPYIPGTVPGTPGSVAMLNAADGFIPYGTNSFYPMPQIQHYGQQGFNLPVVSDMTRRRDSFPDTTCFPPNVVNPTATQNQAQFASILAECARRHRPRTNGNQAQTVSSSVQADGSANLETSDSGSEPGCSRDPSPDSVEEPKTSNTPPNKPDSDRHAVAVVSERAASSSPMESETALTLYGEVGENDTGRIESCLSVEDLLARTESNSPKALRNLWPRDIYEMASRCGDGDDRLKRKICQLDADPHAMTRLAVLASCLMINSPEGSDQAFEMKCSLCPAKFGFLPDLEEHVDGHLVGERHLCEVAREIRGNVMLEAKRPRLD